MAINNVSVQNNGGFLPDIILLAQCYYHRPGNSFKCHGEVWYYLQPMVPPLNVLTLFILTGGCSEGLDAFRFVFKHTHKYTYIRVEGVLYRDEADRNLQ